MGTISVTVNGGNDAVIHAPVGLTTELLSFKEDSLARAGTVELRWQVNAADYADVMEGDMFTVLRSLTGKMEDMEPIGSVAFESGVSYYTYQDDQLISALTTEQFAETTQSPTAHYMVVRATTQQMWGLSGNAASTTAALPLPTLHLLRVSDYDARWDDETARTVSVTWQYADERGAVWDSRAQMQLLVSMTNREGEAIDTVAYTLTAAEMAACRKVVQLTRSCVNYKMEFAVAQGESPLPLKLKEVTPKTSPSTPENAITIASLADWQAFRQKVASANVIAVNAVLTADITIGADDMVGTESRPYHGTFEGNGHTLTFNVPEWAQQYVAPFRYVNSASFSNLHVTGSINTSQKFAGGLIGQAKSTVSIDRCRSSVNINSTVNGDATNGGFIAHCTGLLFVTIQRSLFDGSFFGANCYNNGGFVGYFGPDYSPTDLYIEQCLFAPSSIQTKQDGCETFARLGNMNYLKAYTSYYTTTYGSAQGNDGATLTQQQLVEALGTDYWQLVETPDSEAPILPTFYYESLGHVVEESLTTRTLQSSVLLTWEKTEDTVDYFEVQRRNRTTGETEWTTISPQMTDMEYEDKTVSPVFEYEYRVRSVNDCEGLHITYTAVQAGHCVQTGKVEGYVRFADGTGVPGVKVIASQYGTKADAAKDISVETDDAGHYVIENLPYWGSQQGAFQLTLSGVPSTDLADDCKDGLFVTFDHASNYEQGRNFTVTSGVKFSGLVMYDGTSIPVHGAHFLVDGREVRTSAGAVESDFEGKFAFRMLRGLHRVQAVMDGHYFVGEGRYVENGTTRVDFQTDVANTYFYDSTLVKLIGRVVGGKVQGDLPLDNSLSTNNLGDALQMVLTLEGDNASWLVFDNTNRNLTQRDTVYTHKKYGKADTNNYYTRVHTERHRMVVSPDSLTGEYQVWLPPVKWKIQQITADGYATLFQDGKTSDVVDLTDSLTQHSDTIKGNWRSRGGQEFTEAVVEYYAQYSRIYRSPVRLERRQQGFDTFDYFGEKTFRMQTMTGEKKEIPIAFPGAQGETEYTFGHPVFSTDRSYGIKLAAVERYYYNNVEQSDRVEVVRLDGGTVTIRNGMVSGTETSTVVLDSVGEANYALRATRTPYLLTGDDALCTVTFTLERDGTTFEGEPLQGYVFSQYTRPGAQDILSIKRPVLVDILRDPPGGGSSAKLSKGSTLKLAYQMDMAWKGGVSIGIKAGTGQDFYTGIWAGMGAGGNYGQVGHASGVFNTSVDVVFSGTGQRAFSYTLTASEDISTDTGSKMVGADADLYMGMETNLFVRPMVAIQAVNDSVFRANGGAIAAGRMVEIARGHDAQDSLYHLVRTEVLNYGQEITSTFAHSQQYLVKQLIPGLVDECRSLMFTGTMAEAQALANSTQKRVYLSLVPADDENRFGVMNTDAKGEYVYNTTNSSYQGTNQALMNYIIVLPSGDDGSVQEDLVHDRCETMGTWVNMIARNEKEKLEATDLVKNFEIDGGATISYSEDFATEYSNTTSYNWLGTDFTHNYFANPDPDSDSYGDKERAEFAMAEIGSILGKTVGKFLAGMFAKTSVGGTSVDDIHASATNPLAQYEISFVGMKWNFNLTPVAAFGVTPKNTESTKYNRKESFTVKMDKKSHLDFDVYYVKMIDSREGTTVDSKTDIFVEENFLNNVDYVEYFLDRDVGSRNIVDDMVKPRGFVYRTRGGATVTPWEGERKTLFYSTGTTLDARTKRIENPVIKMDRQSISGVPHDEPARFKLYMTNESEKPDAVGGAQFYYTLYAESQSNPKGARMTVDGMPLTADGMTVKLVPGEVTEKTLEVWAAEDFDYEDLQVGVISSGDMQCYSAITFSVHYLQTAGSVEIATPGDKWIMNTDAPFDAARGWYMPVIISGFNKNQKNFDHIEFQYKEATRGDDYWTNLCAFYADSTLYRQATGTHEMIPENGNIVTKFYGEAQVMEKAYDLRARLFCRNGNSFITSDSKVLTGIKDTRRPQLFGQPEPKDGIIGAGDNIVFNFSEAIEHNYLQAATNFEVKGETNETALSEEPSLLFSGTGYAETDARRNFADKNMTIDLMVRPDETGRDMPLFSHGADGHTLQLWLTSDWHLRAVVDNATVESQAAVQPGTLQQVALILDNEHKQVLLYNDSIVGTMNDVTYRGYGPLIFGATNEIDIHDRQHYSGRMLEARLWNRTMTAALLGSYGKRQLTGYEMGLVDYYPMNDGESQYAVDKAQGANAELFGATWALPRGMSLSLDWEEEKAVKGMQLDYAKMTRSAEQAEQRLRPTHRRRRQEQILRGLRGRRTALSHQRTHAGTRQRLRRRRMAPLRHDRGSLAPGG